MPTYRARRAASATSGPWLDEPAGSADQLVFRQYNDYVTNVLTNLAANPTERAGLWADTAIHCLVQEVTGAELTQLDTCIAQAQALPTPMPIFPAMRVFATGNPPFSKWVDRDYWIARADDLRSLAAHRVAGDPRIGLDIENYGIGGEEPTLTTLAAAGYTEDQFNYATQPFMDACFDLGVYLSGVYPTVSADAASHHLLADRLIETLGADRVELWWELSFGLAIDILRNPETSAANLLYQLRQYESQYERELGISGLRHRHVISADVYCNWGQKARDILDAFGVRRPWVYDNWRVVNSVEQRTKYGLPSFKNGTSSYTVNDWDYWFECAPNTDVAPVSVGTAATPVTLNTHRSADQLTSSIGPVSLKDLSGWKLSPGSNPSFPTDIYGVFRASLLPVLGASKQYTWTIYVELLLPSSLASTKPLLSQCFVNFGSWQIYYDQPSDAIMFDVAGVYTASTILASPARDTTIQLAIARVSSTSFKYCANGGAVTTVVTPAAGVIDQLVIGGGEEVAGLHTANKIESCPDIIIRRVGVAWRTMSDAEIGNVMSLGYPAGY